MKLIIRGDGSSCGTRVFVQDDQGNESPLDGVCKATIEIDAKLMLPKVTLEVMRDFDCELEIESAAVDIRKDAGVAQG